MGRIQAIVNKVKNVVTLKTLRENFFKNDGSLSQWSAHGSTEAANMILHGHPAPVYAGNVSPSDAMGGPVAAPDNENPSQLETAEVASPSQEVSFLSQRMQNIQQTPEVSDPEMELAQ